MIQAPYASSIATRPFAMDIAGVLVELARLLGRAVARDRSAVHTAMPTQFGSVDAETE